MTTKSSNNPLTTATTAWHTLDAGAVFQKIASSEAGLSSEQVQERLRLHGPNQITKKPTDSVLQLLWRQINNPLIWVLLGSAGLAILLGKVTDGLVVLSVVVINAVIGFIQEFKAGRAIEALSGMVPQNAMVVRDGRAEREIISVTDITDRVAGIVTCAGTDPRVGGDTLACRASVAGWASPGCRSPDRGDRVFPRR